MVRPTGRYTFSRAGQFVLFSTPNIFILFSNESMFIDIVFIVISPEFKILNCTKSHFKVKKKLLYISRAGYTKFVIS